MGLGTAFVSLLTAASIGLAHPHGGKPLQMSRRSLSHCDQHFAKRDFQDIQVTRRAAEWRRIRKERGLEDKPVIHGRDFIEVINKDHKSSMAVTPDTPDLELFANSGNCVLSPEVTEGPLYVRGEEVRRELTEGESGVKMTIDIQVVDVNTCKPMETVALDFWSCNSTGVYGGVLNYPGNGNPNDLSLINTTTLRGIQFTNVDGVATFDTVVPGHYAGRTNHVHAIAHVGAKQLPNGTITGGSVAHIGQMYFDQSLLKAVEGTQPYASNTQTWTQNAQDILLQQGANGDDPVVQYVLIGDSIEDGIFAWIRFGVDPKANRPLNAAAYIDESGGHQSPGKGFGTFPGFGGDWGPILGGKKEKRK